MKIIIKKSFVFLIFLFSARVFALSDVGFGLGLFNDHSNFKVDSRQFVEEGNFFDIGVQNYNLLDKQNHIGFFEKLSFSQKDDFAMSLMFGPGFGFNIYKDLLRVETGAGFHFLYSYSKNVDSFSEENKINLNKFAIGLAADFEFKFLPENTLSPVLGFEAGWDPFCRGGTVLNGSNYYINYNTFYLIFFRPFVGCVWNISSKKKNGSQHNQNAQDF